ncbi:MAG: cob(I)yrinic acid a,c-diamide adenosyltransferase [Bacteroidales bacterium]|nr:cob(I)yrinic acid a,c-diamide adenosyltransferase [Bacteroidales bacterium]
MIYTKTGDKGTTSLVGGSRVAKNHPRVECYGTIDELNSQVAVVAELVKGLQGDYYRQLKEIQHHLFVVQTLLATEEPSMWEKLPQLPADATERLERHIDEYYARLPHPNAFVIPGGTLASAQCHVARCVCRRAERLMVSVQQESALPEGVPAFVNRLSDYLFALARILVVAEGQEEHYWTAKP